MNIKSVLVLITLVIVGIATRFLDLWPNFNALGAVAIFGAFYFKGVWRFVVPILALWVSDLVLNNMVYAEYYDSTQFFGNPSVYLGFIAVGLCAYYILQKKSWTRLLLTSVVGAIVFYLISNFGTWISTNMYTRNFSGLQTCYEMGLPFFRFTLLGNVVFTFLLFGIYEYVLSVQIEGLMPRLRSTLS